MKGSSFMLTGSFLGYKSRLNSITPKIGIHSIDLKESAGPSSTKRRHGGIVVADETTHPDSSRQSGCC